MNDTSWLEDLNGCGGQKYSQNHNYKTQLRYWRYQSGTMTSKFILEASER